MLRKILLAVLALLFGLFAYFQYNDPDSLGWILYYLYLAGLCGFAAAGRYSYSAMLMAFGATFFGLVLFAPGLWDNFSNPEGFALWESMSNDKPFIEESREFGGLVIALLGLLAVRRLGQAQAPHDWVQRD